MEIIVFLVRLFGIVSGLFLCLDIAMLLVISFLYLVRFLFDNYR